MELILGIDDAGRGPVIGPMIMAGCLMDKDTESKLKKLGIKDSKQLTQKRREILSEKIKEEIETFEIVLSKPIEIDYHLNTEGTNLNNLEANMVAEIINRINKGYTKIRVVIDCPSKRILETICDEEIPITTYTLFQKGMKKEQEEKLMKSFLTGLIYQIAENYNYSAKINQIDTGKIEPIKFGLFMGSKGICYGFQDSGDYFKSEHTKRIYENKIPIIKNQSIENGLQRFRVGVTNFLYPYSDLIEVDTKKGVLYCIQLKESIEIIK